MNGSSKTVSAWRLMSEPFQRRHLEYDSWFVDNPIFAIEVATIQSIRSKISSPTLEIGIGPGRFAQSLGTEFGIDPALAPLQLAKSRGARVCRAIGEQLPFRKEAFGSIQLLFSLCFIAEPEKTLDECRRTLKTGGNLVIGMVPAKSSWGVMLRKKGEMGHPFYQRAHLRTIAQTLVLLKKSGFDLVESRSALFSLPQEAQLTADHQSGHDENAGFAVLVAEAT